MSGAAVRTLIFLAFAVTGVVLAVGLILPGRGLLADALRDILAPGSARAVGSSRQR